MREDNGGCGRVGQELLAALVQAVEHDEPPGGGRWTGIKAKLWLNQRLEKPIPTSTAYNTLHRAKLSWQVPRPRHLDADAAAQDEFQKKPLKARSKK